MARHVCGVDLPRPGDQLQRLLQRQEPANSCRRSRGCVRRSTWFPPTQPNLPIATPSCNGAPARSMPLLYRVDARFGGQRRGPGSSPDRRTPAHQSRPPAMHPSLGPLSRIGPDRAEERHLRSGLVLRRWVHEVPTVNGGRRMAFHWVGPSTLEVACTPALRVHGDECRSGSRSSRHRSAGLYPGLEIASGR